MLARETLERAPRIARRCGTCRTRCPSAALRARAHQRGGASPSSNSQVNRSPPPRSCRLYTGCGLAHLARFEQQRTELARGFGPLHAPHLRARASPTWRRRRRRENDRARVPAGCSPCRHIEESRRRLRPRRRNGTRPALRAGRRAGRAARPRAAWRAGSRDRARSAAAPRGHAARTLRQNCQQRLRIGHGAMAVLDHDAMTLHDGIEIVARHLGIQRARQPHRAQVAGCATASPRRANSRRMNP